MSPLWECWRRTWRRRRCRLASEPAPNLPSNRLSRPAGTGRQHGGTMRILVVAHYCPPEVGAPQARLSELAAWWAHQGEDVTVLTGMPNHPTGVVPRQYRGKLRVRESRAGYRIVRT